MCVRGGGGEAVDLYSPSRSLSFFLSFCCSSNMQKSTKERERAQMSDKRVRGLRTAVYLFCGAVSIPFFFLYILNVYSRTETTTINKYLAATTAVLATRERGEESAASQAKCAPQ